MLMMAVEWRLSRRKVLGVVLVVRRWNDKFFKKTKPNNKCGHLMLFLLVEDKDDIRLPLSNFVLSRVRLRDF